MFELLCVVFFLKLDVLVDGFLPLGYSRAGLFEQQCGRLIVFVGQGQIEHLVVDRTRCIAGRKNLGAVGFAGFAGWELLQRFPGLVVSLARLLYLDRLALFLFLDIKEHDGSYYARDDVHRLRQVVVDLDLDVVVQNHIFQVVLDGGESVERQPARGQRKQHHQAKGRSQAGADFEVR